VRCFVALDLADGVREALARVVHVLREAAPRADVRWVDPRGIHLTLKFLGEVPEDRLPALVAALAPAVGLAAPLALTALGVGGFPTVRRPRVVWVGVGGAVAALTALAAGVDRALEPLGFAPGGRPFAAHLTIGRVRSPRGIDRLAAALERAPSETLCAWRVDEVVLYRSHLRPTGAVYEPLRRLSLGGDHP
jgi:2'-5' RNA ligase